MKAKNLMLKDWIYKKGYKHPLCVSQVNNGSVCIEEYFTTKAGIRKQEYVIEDDDIEPIPLTSEILEKNLFVRSMSVSDTEPYDLDEEGYAYYQVGNLGIDKPHLWGWFKDNKFIMPCDCTNWVTIEYIHELQHALRIVGIHGLADNFKVE